MTTISFLDAKRILTGKSGPLPHEMEPEDFFGLDGELSLKAQFNLKGLRPSDKREFRNWLTGHSYIPGTLTGPWFWHEREGQDYLYVESELDQYRVNNRWAKLGVVYDPDEEPHNQYVLATRFFNAAGEQHLGKALVAVSSGWQDVPIARPNLPYGESVMKDPAKLVKLHRMWGGRTIAC